ncbi:Synaptogyrin-2 [Geranomyces variabilis]|nr:Synaptogyrin-2 [Geranomyces variabilis]
MSSYDTGHHQHAGAPLPSGTAPYSVAPTAQGALDTLRQPRLLLRAVEWLFALIAFSAAAHYGSQNDSAVSFMVAVGVIAWLLTSAILLAAIFKPHLITSRPYFYTETGISGVWTVFWFAGSIALAVKKCFIGCGDKNASVAFGFFSCAAWAVSTWWAGRELQRI